MDNPSITPRTAAHHGDARTGAGELTTFYSYQSGPARSMVVATMARLLASRQPAAAPVLMIDWDLESPGLHYVFGVAAEADNARPGLLELIEACRCRYGILVQAARVAGGALDADAISRQALAAIDWGSHIERVDADRPLYMLRAGRFDHDYGERAARLDWHALYRACPGLLRQLRLQLAQAYRHVFIDARSGRSAAASICTALLPDRIVGLFTPHPASLDGLCGTVERAIAYRVSHEDEQRPLLLYPLPCLSGGDRAERVRWRRGYQERLEALMRASYGRAPLSLERYCDDILLDTAAFLGQDASDAAAAADHRRPHEPGAPVRTLAALLDWFGHFPWQASEDGSRIHPIRPSREGGSSHGAQEPDAPAPHSPESLQARSAAVAAQAQFPALRQLATLRHCDSTARTPARESGFEARRESVLDGSHMRRLVDAVEAQLDQLQQLVDQQALREARPLADKLRDLVLRPAVALAMRRRGAALIKLVYRHDNDTDALLAFTQDELAALERVLSDAAAGRPLAYS
jgi:hypothetical protein